MVASISLEPPRVFGTILVSPDRKVLLVKGRKTGKWSFPKGHPEKEEGEYQCALRETAEETGIHLNGKYEEVLNLSKGRYFVHHLSSKPCIEIHDFQEIQDIQWWTLREMHQLSRNVDISYFLNNYSEILWTLRTFPVPSVPSVPSELPDLPVLCA